ncbi:MAG TPA: beta-ketoacyl synthase [Pseudomonadales bacterium]
MKRLPVIVGFGGINPAGRVSFHHAYRRLVIEALGEIERDRTYESLAKLMRVDDPAAAATRSFIDAHTLIRRIELFDPDRVPVNRAARLHSTEPDEPFRFLMSTRYLPEQIPGDWQVESVGDSEVRVTVPGRLDVYLPDTRTSRVTSAGQLPTGFDPGDRYQSRSHPRGLQLTVFGASDAVRSTGIDLQALRDAVPADQMAVYSGSAMGQLDNEGYGGMFQNPLLGRRPTAKNVPLGLNEMPGDFINAYVLGSAGGAAGIIGACATFLYNVRAGCNEIMSGRKRIVLVGNAEAPVVPEVIEGYRTMGALMEDEQIMALDGTSTPNHRRACRPFSTNGGFTVAESAVYTLLMDDELALSLGARILGSVPGVFVNADGYKKSIPGPGIGNYLTVGRAMGLARAILGDDGLRQRTHMQAHGTGTPQNRVTESHILNEFARIHGIDAWPVGAVKAYVGHSMAPAGGDQLAAVLGTWAHGWLPGITTIDHIAEDVHHDRLELPMHHRRLEDDRLDGAFINSKGFGGNNATGFFLSPDLTMQMLAKRWGKARVLEHQRLNESVAERAADYDSHADDAETKAIYHFGEGVVEGKELAITATEIRIPGLAKPVSLVLDNPFPDMCD